MATCPKCRATFGDDVKYCLHDGEALLSDAAFAGVDPDLEAGQEVGEYEIVEKIGEGGFGTVYRARQPLIGKEVAIKLLNREYSSNPQMVSRFIEEARAVNQIRHRNIIDIFSFGTHEDKRQFFVMEFLEGKPFDEYLAERKRLAPEEAIPILRQIAKALDAAHTAGIAHRDLKPENVFLSFDDGEPFPKLLDFGIAKLLGGSRRSGHKTATGQPIGTPYYMSPEQCLGSGVDHRADIYSFGVMCHEVLAGKLPFYAEEMMNVLVMHMSKAPPTMSAVCPDLPPALDGPVLAMLAKDPEHRPESVQTGLEALAQAAKDAGFGVEVAAIRRGGASTPGMVNKPVISTTPGKLTPTEQALMGAAATVADSGPVRVHSATPSPSTLSAAHVEPMAPTQRAPGGGGRGKLVGGVVALLAVVAIGAVFFMRGGDPGPAADPQPTADVATTTAVETPTSEPTAAETATTAEPSAVEEVELTIQSTPPHVGVFLGDKRLGTAPGPIRIDRSEEPVELTFKASGYGDQTKKVTPRTAETVAVRLIRAGGSRPAKPITAKTGKPKPTPAPTAKPIPKGLEW